MRVSPHMCHIIYCTLNQTYFQTHFSPIPDLLSDCFDCEKVETEYMGSRIMGLKVDLLPSRDPENPVRNC